MKIKVKLFNKNCEFETTKKGDWIDLKASQTISFKAPIANRLTKKNTARNLEFDYYMVPLGIGMKLPKGYEAIIAPRSSSYKKFGFIVVNSIGVIDRKFSGPNDQWHLPIVPLKAGTINEGDRICQFKIQLSQFATIWQRIKWLFGNKPIFEFVDDYEGVDRQGFGSTGV